MKYQGSKTKFAKQIIECINTYRKNNNNWIEPFVGGANIIDKVLDKIKIGYDSNKYLISLLNGIKEKKDVRNIITKEQYEEAKSCYKDNKTTNFYDLYEIGYIGFLASFRGTFFTGFNGGGVIKKHWKHQRNYYKNDVTSLLKQIPNIKDVVFICSEYKDIIFPPNSTIYCDPPYENTKQYGKIKFNHEPFWEWVREQTNKGHDIFVSEYQAPDDFVCILEMPTKCTFSGTNGIPRVEKLFMLKR